MEHPPGDPPTSGHDLQGLMQSLRTVFVDEGVEVGDESTGCNIDAIISFAEAMSLRRDVMPEQPFQGACVPLSEASAAEVMQGVQLKVPGGLNSSQPPETGDVQELFDSFVTLNRKVRLSGRLNSATSREMCTWRRRWISSPDLDASIAGAAGAAAKSTHRLDGIAKPVSRSYRWLPLSGGAAASPHPPPQPKAPADFLRSVLPGGALAGVLPQSVPSYTKLVDELKAAYEPKLQEFHGTPVRIKPRRGGDWTECSACGQELVCLTCTLARRHDPFRCSRTYQTVSARLSAIVRDMHSGAEEELAAEGPGGAGKGRADRAQQATRRQRMMQSPAYQEALTELRERFNCLMEKQPYRQWFFEKDVQIAALADEQDETLICLQQQHSQEVAHLQELLEASQCETLQAREDTSNTTRKYEAQLVRYEESLAELKEVLATERTRTKAVEEREAALWKDKFAEVEGRLVQLSSERRGIERQASLFQRWARREVAAVRGSLDAAVSAIEAIIMQASTEQQALTEKLAAMPEPGRPSEVDTLLVKRMSRKRVSRAPPRNLSVSDHGRGSRDDTLSRGSSAQPDDFKIDVADEAQGSEGNAGEEEVGREEEGDALSKEASAAEDEEEEEELTEEDVEMLVEAGWASALEGMTSLDVEALASRIKTQLAVLVDNVRHAATLAVSRCGRSDRKRTKRGSEELPSLLTRSPGNGLGREASVSFEPELSPATPMLPRGRLSQVFRRGVMKK